MTRALRDSNPQVPWEPMVRMRNIVAHVYFGIDWDEVWAVAVGDLPALRPQIKAILAALPGDDTPPGKCA